MNKELIFYEELNKTKRMIYSDSLWCFKDILDGIIDAEIEDKFEDTLEISEDILYSNRYEIEIFTSELKILTRIFELFLDKLEYIIDNNIDGIYSKDDEDILTITLEIAKNISTFCTKNIIDDNEEFSKKLYQEIIDFNRKYEEL